MSPAAMMRVRRRPRPEPDTNRGFVLVGVVMFVLALTILGFTLFDLSGYEAQFTRRAIASDEAFFAACSGLEHAKFVLAKTGSLDKVADPTLFPDPNLMYARARRMDNDDTTGTLGGGSPAVEIRALATVQGESRMVQARYNPFQAANVYKRLMTVRDGVQIEPLLRITGLSPIDSAELCVPGLEKVRLSGTVAQSTTDDDWQHCTLGGDDIDIRPDLPTPDLDSFFSRFYANATEVGFSYGGGSPRAVGVSLKGGYTVPGGPPNVQFFKTTQASNEDLPPVHSGDEDKVSVWAGGVLSIDIRGTGTAVWLIDHGMRTELEVDIQANPGDCLVIAAKRCNLVDSYGDWRARGIWFFGGFDNPDVPVILVSEGDLVLEHYNNYDQSSVLNYVSIFARRAIFQGPPGPLPWPPVPGATLLHLRHTSGHPFDIAGGRIDQLCELGALPNSDTAGMRFNRVAGTFKELNPNNPPYPY